MAQKKIPEGIFSCQLQRHKNFAHQRKFKVHFANIAKVN